jgi:hypothetical protein
VKHERVTVGVLQATDMAHGPDTIRARLDDRQAILLSRLMNDAGPAGATPPIVRGWGRSPGAHDPRLARPRAQRGRARPRVSGLTCAAAGLALGIAQGLPLGIPRRWHASPVRHPRQRSELAVVERQELGQERADTPSRWGSVTSQRPGRRAAQVQIQRVKDGAAEGFAQRPAAVNGRDREPSQVALIDGVTRLDEPKSGHLSRRAERRPLRETVEGRLRMADAHCHLQREPGRAPGGLLALARRVMT